MTNKCKHKFTQHIWRGAMDGNVLSKPALLAVCENCGDHKISGELVEGKFEKRGRKK